MADAPPRVRSIRLAIVAALLSLLAVILALLPGRPGHAPTPVPLPAATAPLEGTPATAGPEDTRTHGGTAGAEPRPEPDGAAPPPAPVRESHRASHPRISVEAVGASGRAVAGASFAILAGSAGRSDLPSRPPRPVATAIADDDGRAVLELPPPDGDTRLLLQARGRGTAGLAAIPGTPGAGTVRVVLRPVAPLTGRVASSEGPLLEGIDVVAGFQMEDASGSAIRAVAAARTGSGGGFRIDGIPREAFAHPVTVRALRGPGHGPADVVLPPPDPPSEEVLLVVEPTCRLRGRCVDAKGAPVAGATVTVGVGPGHSAGGGPTDAGGTFDFEAPRRATWSLMARADGKEPFLRRDVPCDAPIVDAGLLVLEEERVCLIRGRCLRTDGTPWAGADVSAGVGPGHSVGGARTDAGGRFTIRARPGIWAVMVGQEVWWREVDGTGAEVDLGTRSGPEPPR